MTITAHHDAEATLPPLRPEQDVERLAHDYARDGAVRVRGLFTEDDLTAIRTALDHHLDTVVPTLDRDVHREADGKAIRVANELQRYSPYFDGLINDPRVTGLLSRITGWEPQPFYAEYFAKRPGGAVANPHQDSAFEAVAPHQYVHVWIALDDITPDMGPLVLWLGSHRAGTLPHQLKDFSGFQYITAEVLAEHDFRVATGTAALGDAFVFDTAVIHASGPNTSVVPRPSLALAYRGAQTRVVENQS